MKNHDDIELDSLLDKLLDGKDIEVNELAENTTSAKMVQLQQLMHSFIPHQNDFNPNDLLGQSWGEMQVKEILGQGGMGVVYLAYDNVLDRQVALKVLNGNALNYMDSESFVHEAQLMAQVRHPHIMAVHGASIHNNIAGYWGELLNGKAVEDYLIDKSPLADRELNNLCLGLTEAVQAIHSKGLVHGDIKSNNVIIEEKRGAVLMDFGSSFEVNENNMAWFRPSTPLAMAPEQFNGEKPTQASDIFSLGVLFHLLVTGEYPFYGANFEELKKAVLENKRKYFPIQTNNKAYKKLIDKMLCPLPEDSPSIEEVALELQKIRHMPLQKVKNRLYTISTLALLTITAASLYLAYTIKQSEIKLSLASAQTESVNDVLTSIIVAPSSIRSGKDVLVKDMVAKKYAEVKANNTLNSHTKNRLYKAFYKSFTSFEDSEKQSELLQSIIDSQDSDHSYKRLALIDLAEIKITAHEYQQAEKLLVDAQLIKLPNADQQIKSDIYWNMAYANFYFEQEDNKKSLDYSKIAVGLWDKTKLHFDASVSYSHLGNALLGLSKYQEASEAFKSCIDIAKKFERAENFNVFACKSQLASVLAQLGRFKEAIELNQEMIKTADNFLGNDTAELFLLKMNYSVTLANAGQIDKSLLIKEQLLVDSEKYQIPAIYPVFLKGGIAYLYLKLERFGEAEMLFEKVITDFTEYYSPKNPATLTHINNLAELYNLTNRPEKAIALLKENIIELYAKLKV